MSGDLLTGLVSAIFKEGSTPWWLESRVGRLGVRHIQFTSQALFVVGDIPQGQDRRGCPY